MIDYVCLPAVTLNDRCQEALDGALRIAQRELGLKDIRVQWFKANDKHGTLSQHFRSGRFHSEGINGKVKALEPSVVYLNHDLAKNQFDLYRVCLHEVFHSFQQIQCLGWTSCTDSHEREARSFASLIQSGDRRGPDGWRQWVQEKRTGGRHVAAKTGGRQVAAPVDLGPAFDGLSADVIEGARREAQMMQKIAKDPQAMSLFRGQIKAQGNMGTALLQRNSIRSKKDCHMKCLDGAGTCGKGNSTPCATSRSVKIPIERAQQNLDRVKAARVVC